MLDQSQNNHVEAEKEAIKACCPFNKISSLICMNQKCTQNAFVCYDIKCECRKAHSKCIKTDTQSVIQNIKSRVVSVNALEKLIDGRIKNIIDFLSDTCEKLTKQIKEQFVNFGLGDNEKKFIHQVFNENQLNITGEQIWEIIHSEHKQQSFNKVVQQSTNFLTDNLQKSFQDLEKSFESVEKQIQKCSIQGKKIIRDIEIPNYLKSKSIFLGKQAVPFYKSNIVTCLDNYKNIESFFASRNQIKYTRLLYRASENDFDVKKFHDKCDNVGDTLTLVETEFSKKIGGYTPMKWTRNGKYQKDESLKSFLFSLTHGVKFNLINKEKAIFSDENYGPIFGDRSDLIITNKANTNNHSCAYINRNFQNKNYLQNNEESLKKFIGDGSKNNFKIKQWEVWALVFY